MRKVNLLKAVIITLCAISLNACVDVISERRGAELQVVPITYTLNLSVKKNKEKAAWRELDQYVENNWDRIATQQLIFTWYTSTGNKLAEDYQKHLLSKGLNRNQITISKGVIQEELAKDLTFETVVNKVFSSICSYEKVGTFGKTESGCYAESARWKSMVNPEKMLAETNNK
ncbi:hypothetical protein [Vibrio sp. VB16]|uniref:hypothetical protein n=1 Tax=Vibrio sp. VB16 TaxID=2785746 RepID=UPI00189F12BC|nr:hypothetical protein [Vibrio sp. VB16]UGA54219.1 hypothetical protein IUZ65_013245 [Vibrio sp. VB16]